MRLKNISIDKNYLLLSYKLLCDALLLALVAFAAVLTADGLLPGLVSSKISFTKIALVIILLISAITYLGQKLQIIYSHAKMHSGRTLSVLVLFSFLLLGNSMLKFSLWENIIITLSTLFIFFLFYELIFSSDSK